MDVANCISDVLYRLGFIDSTDLAQSTSWVTSVELYQWADEAVKKLAYEAGVFTVADASITVVIGTPVYNLPASHVFTLAAWLASNPLRITPVRELWALDGKWNATSGPASRCSMDAGSVGTITLYPVPNAGGTLTQVCQEFPATVALGSSTLALASVLQDYLSYAMMAGARGKESEAAMPEMAEHFAERCRLYEQVIQKYFGPGQ